MGLRTKFLLSLVIATTGITMASLWLVRRSVEKQLRPQLEESLTNSAKTFQETFGQREIQAERTVQFITKEPRIIAFVASNDPPTVQDGSKDIWEQSGASIMLLSGTAGKLLAVHTADPTLSREKIDSRLQQSLKSSSTRDWWLIDDHLFEVFLQPIYSVQSEERIPRGVAVLGFEIDKNLVNEAAAIASGNVAFRFGNRFVVSTLPAAQTAELNQYAASVLADRKQEITIGGETFLVRGLELQRDGDARVEVVMLKSFDVATGFLTALNRPMLAIALLAVILGTGFVFFISHTFTRPIADLVSGVRALAKGDYSYPLKTAGKDEVAELTITFDKMRQSLQESQSRAVNAARMEAIGQLAGGVAHDFNNLVTIIKGYTELLLLKLTPGDPTVGYAEQIRKAGDRAASVTRQLLAFSRKQVLQPDVIDLNSIAIGMEKMLKVLIGEDIEIKITSEAGLRKVLADPGQVEQILLNLAVNARDAMPKGGKINVITTNVNVDPAQVRAAIGVPHAGSYVRLSFTDTGSGMPAEVAANVFQPFFTTKETGKGTGLGLAIVCGIVKQSGGFITLTSEPGRGTTFEVFFPEAEKAMPTITSEAVAARPVMKASETVLLVEDEDALRALGREALRMNGYTVLEASNGLDALDVFAGHAYQVDVVVTDVVMPQLSGVDLVEKLRARVPNLKVLFISGYTERTDEIERSGFRLLQKPFTPDQLAKAVGETIRNGAPTAARAVVQVE